MLTERPSARRARARPRHDAASGTATGGFRMLPTMWYETHHLGGCQRLAAPRAECSGWDSPKRPSLAVVVPARAVDASLLCTRLAAHLRRFRVRHRLFVVNQVDSLPFNRGALANAAVRTLLLDDRLAIDYLAIQDVDRFPVLDNRSCDAVTSEYYAFPPKTPRGLHPTSFAGGVLLIRTALSSGQRLLERLLGLRRGR